MDRKVLIGIGLGLVGGWAAWRFFGDGTDLVDVVVDELVTLTSSDEDRLSQMGADAQAAARQLIQELANNGIAVKVGQTLRSPAQEKAAIDSGHSAVKSHSWHEIGRAVDLYPIDPDTGKADMNGSNLDLFVQMHAIARQLGWRGIAFESDGVTRHYINGRNGPIWDGGHLEWRAPYGSIAEAVAAEGPDYGIA